MTALPSEREIQHEAAMLLDDVLTASRVFMTSAQQTQALTAIELRLDDLRRRWRQNATP